MSTVLGLGVDSYHEINSCGSSKRGSLNLLRLMSSAVKPRPTVERPISVTGGSLTSLGIGNPGGYYGCIRESA
jgi:hypothetical protein